MRTVDATSYVHTVCIVGTGRKITLVDPAVRAGAADGTYVLSDHYGTQNRQYCKPALCL